MQEKIASSKDKRVEKQVKCSNQHENVKPENKAIKLFRAVFNNLQLKSQAIVRLFFYVLISDVKDITLQHKGASF